MNLRDPLKHMLKMEGVLSYLLDHLEEKINIEDVARMNHYNPVHFARLFLEYFEYPFAKYIVMLRLRKCARDILENRSLKDVGNTYGYATAASFSKAFRNEFGISPREFLKKSYYPPDMPERKAVNKVPISLEYKSLPAFSVGGYGLPYVSMMEASWYEQAYPCQSLKAGNPQTLFAMPGQEKQNENPDPGDSDPTRYGLWYCDEDQKLHYLFGPVLRKGERKKKNMIRVRMRASNFAVFSFDRRNSEEENLKFTRLLHQYIFKEWIPLNRKIRDTKSCTFIKCDKEKVELYVPILRGMYGQETIAEIDWKVAGWCRYIDEHITDDLTVRSLAGKWGYSEPNFRMVFDMYYGIVPEEYIRKKRLYLAASALHAGTSAEEVVSLYHFSSAEDFENQFLQEFGTHMKDFKSLDVEPVDLIQYYQHYKKSVHIKFRNLLSQKAAVKLLDRREEIVQESEMPSTGETGQGQDSETKRKGDSPRREGSRFISKEDIPSTAAFWFTHDFDCLKGTEYEIDERERPSRIFIWKDEPVIENGEAFYDYYLGPIVRKEAGVPEGMTEIIIPGGNYAVFRTENHSDKDDLTETYRMLTRVAFGGWIDECRFRVDYSRPTFVNYKRQKLFFYVPVVL